MKKIVSIILTLVLILSLSACVKDDSKNNESSAYEKQTLEKSQDNEKGNNTQSDKTEDSKNKKIVITPDVENAKLSFKQTNNNITNVKKTYYREKNLKFEDYTDKNITERTINFLGKEFKNVPYVNSRKNPYKNRDEDVFENEEITVHITKTGEIRVFDLKTPMNFFPNENKPSVELAKKYLNAIAPDFEYDEVEEKVLDSYKLVRYTFYKAVNGIPTSEEILFYFKLTGEFSYFRSYDVGMYDNVEIKGPGKDVYFKKATELIKNTYGDVLKDYRISEDGPFYEIYSGNKLELTFPIGVEINTPEGYAYAVGEYIVFELN